VPGVPATESDTPSVPEVLSGDVEPRGSSAEPPEAEAARGHRVVELPPPPRGESRSPAPPALPTSIEVGPAESSSPPVRGSAWLASAVVHCLLLIVLALIVDRVEPPDRFGGVIARMTDPPEEMLREEWIAELIATEPDRTEGTAAEIEMNVDVEGLDELGPEPRPTEGADAFRVGMGPTHQSDLLMLTDRPMGGGLDGRQPDARAALAEGRGGTPASEGAVERGLRWLALHQREDGSWHFNHRTDMYRGVPCRNPGTEPSTTAATAMAMLPFLGAGYTHQKGEYRENLRKGIYYLTRRTLLTDHGYDMREGTMYAQGLATMALCEAYAMTGDENLRDFAQGGIDFICYAQDKSGGGWRYMPGEPGDTTVTGWQLMALKSGQMAGLSVPSPTIFLAKRFLKSVQSDYGAQYGYMDPRPRKTTTAIGLLLRMYTGWPRNHAELGRGVRYLSEWKPSKDDVYYNYYASQVLNHYGGPLWEAWNEEMRDYLIETQSHQGMENGSWYFPGPHSEKGGRLYNTAMAVMILEVYYRYQPLYSRQVFETGF